MPLLLSFLMLLQTIPPAQNLTRLEQQLTDALVRSDTKIVDSLWAEDLVWVGLNGKPSTKAERLSGMKATPAAATPVVVSATNKDVRVRVYGGTAVVTLVSTWVTRANDRETSDNYIATHVWSRQQGKWLLVSAHISRVAP